ncbi:MAG TPA: TIGR03668 family PPOX class F420-dependent oxidoreductase [Pseudomonadales bacterium]
MQSYTTLPSKGAPVQLNPQQLSHVLAVWPVARLASVGEQGQPHLVPIVFVYVDGVIYSPIDGKPKRGDTLQRLRNVAHQTSTSVLLDHYDADWQQLWWLRIDGDATVESAGHDSTIDFDRIAQELRTKYPQYRSVDVYRETPTLLGIRPRRHVAWSAGTVVWESLRLISAAL